MSFGGQTPVFVMSKFDTGCVTPQQGLTLYVQMLHQSDNLGGKLKSPTSLPQKCVLKCHFFWNAEHPIENQTVADVIRTCLGPKAMLKMILDPMGGIM
jgi:hypothetical protein